MCGIYGITTRDPDYINQFIKVCSHRGPDGSDIWFDDYITLGHNLLSITSAPDQGKQPWETEIGVLTYNGEIFNYPDLVKKYSNQWQPRTSCDTELLAWHLSTQADGVVDDDFDTMHAYAWYNKKDKKLFLSRDHVGIKPLYYAEISEGIVFGSEIKGMLDKVPGSRQIDEMAAATMSYSGLNPGRNTLFKGIKKVMPGETLVYDVVAKKFIGSQQNIITPTSRGKFDIEEFKHMAHQTVRMSTIGIRKIGIFLSGGLDSTLVAHELSKVLDNVNSFTNVMKPNVIIGEDHNDDANHAKRFAKDFGFNHKEIEITPQTIMDCWNQSMATMEQPVYNMSIPMYYKTNQRLSENGIVVTMAGDMGDELLGGYPKYWKLKKEQIYSHKDLIWKWMHRIKRPIQLTNKVNPQDIFEDLISVIPDSIWNPADPINSYMALDCITQVPEEFFSRNDKFGMRFGMEGRFPLATKLFMKYCMEIPSSYKIGQDKSDTKMPTKLAYNGVLPNYIIQKMKTGWTVPLIYWLGDNQDLQSFAMSYMNAQDGLKQQISMDNWKNKKTRVISWMMRSWAQQYRMTL